MNRWLSYKVTTSVELQDLYIQVIKPSFSQLGSPTLALQSNILDILVFWKCFMNFTQKKMAANYSSRYIHFITLTT